MANSLNSTCQICGKKYHYCGDCSKHGSWRRIVDTPEHYQIVMILTDYREEVINDREAAQRFNNIGITIDSDFSVYLDAVARDIKKILKRGAAKKTERTVKNSTKHDKE